MEQQYFEHLCATEDGEYIFRRIADVDGLFILRPRGKTEGSPADSDRMGTEEPTGFGAFSEGDEWEQVYIDWVAERYVQPLYGAYRFVELPNPQEPGVVRVVLKPDFAQFIAPLQRGGMEANLRHMTTRTWATERLSRYGYTWRGVSRPRDRELGIGGGEFIVLDLQTNEVLAVRRTFNSTFVPSSPGYTAWSRARECRGVDMTPPLPVFLQRVLQPDLTLHDGLFANDAARREYRIQRQRMIGSPTVLRSSRDN